MTFSDIDPVERDMRRGINETNHEPLLDLAPSDIRLAVSGVQLVCQPSRMLAEQAHLLPADTGLLAKLAPRGIHRLLALFQAALRKLPRPRDAVPLERENLPAAIEDGNADACSKELRASWRSQMSAHVLAVHDGGV